MLEAVLKHTYCTSDPTLDDRYIESLRLWKFWNRVMKVRNSQRASSSQPEAGRELPLVPGGREETQGKWV